MPAPSADKRISVMISSRIDEVWTDGKQSKRTMEDLREAIQTKLEAVRVGDRPLFSVWRSEKAGAAGETDTARQTCMDQAASCDIVLVLYNGHAGWTRRGIGICHDEYLVARDANRKKVRVVKLESAAASAWIAAARSNAETEDGRFLRAIDTHGSLYASASTFPDAVAVACGAVAQAVLDLVRSPLPARRPTSINRASAIAWEAMRMDERAARMRASLVEAVREHEEPASAAAQPWSIHRLDGARTVAFRAHSVPGSFADAEARAYLGRPFDDEGGHVAALRAAGASGPVEVVAAQRGVTEAQLRRLVPNASVASGPFGFLCWSQDSRAQVVAFRNCVDDDSVRRAWMAFRDWLEVEDLAREVADRAADRLEILDLLASRKRS